MNKKHLRGLIHTGMVIVLAIMIPAVSGALCASAAGAKKSAAMASKATIVFVHGSSYGALCWDNFVSYFSARGYETIAVTLAGHTPGPGNRAAPAGEAPVETVRRAVVEAKKNNDIPVIVVGHSMGGTVTQKFLEAYPDLADGGILLSSAGPENSPKALAATAVRLLFSPRKIVEIVRVFIIGALAPNNPRFVQKSGFFSSRISLEDAAKYAKLLCRQQALDISTEPIDISKIKVPVYVLASDGDVFTTSCEQKPIADIYGTELAVLDDLCHDMMLDPEWEKAAEAVERFAERILAK